MPKMIDGHCRQTGIDSMAIQPLTSGPIDHRPPQFSLRALLWLMAILSAIFATMVAAGVVWSLMLLLVVSLIVAHVLGNAIGTRLRDDDARRSNQTLPQGVQPQSRLTVTTTATPAQELRVRKPLGQLLSVFIAAGAVSGALLGRFVLIHSQWQPMPTSDAIVGIGSCAVLGAIAGFMASSFFKVALWPAVKYFFSRK